MTDSATRIVVGVDGSEPSKEALRWAARLAATEDAGIDAVAAWAYPVGFGVALPAGYDPKADLEKVLTETVDEVFGPDRPADLRLHVFENDPAHMLITLSRAARMIVVGSRGHGGFAGLLLGSVSAKVAELAQCPVLVVHGKAGTPAPTR